MARVIGKEDKTDKTKLNGKKPHLTEVDQLPRRIHVEEGDNNPVPVPSEPRASILLFIFIPVICSLLTVIAYLIIRH